MVDLSFSALPEYQLVADQISEPMLNSKIVGKAFNSEEVLYQIAMGTDKT